jgi:transposase
MDLTDQQWTIIEPLFEEKRRPDGRGRPWRDARAVLNGVLWVLRTGAPWHDLPDRYPPYQTCHRRFQQWCGRTASSATFSRAWRRTCVCAARST